jgi:hypothetical protein
MIGFGPCCSGAHRLARGRGRRRGVVARGPERRRAHHGRGRGAPLPQRRHGPAVRPADGRQGRRPGPGCLGEDDGCRWHGGRSAGVRSHLGMLQMTSREVSMRRSVATRSPARHEHTETQEQWLCRSTGMQASQQRPARPVTPAVPASHRPRRRRPARHPRPGAAAPAPTRPRADRAPRPRSPPSRWAAPACPTSPARRRARPGQPPAAEAGTREERARESCVQGDRRWVVHGASFMRTCVSCPQQSRTWLPLSPTKHTSRPCLPTTCAARHGTRLNLAVHRRSAPAAAVSRQSVSLQAQPSRRPSRGATSRRNPGRQGPSRLCATEPVVRPRPGLVMEGTRSVFAAPARCIAADEDTAAHRQSARRPQR